MTFHLNVQENNDDV